MAITKGAPRKRGVATIDGSVKIQPDGSVLFSSGARQNLRQCDVWTISFFNFAGGSGSRPLLERERRSLGLRGLNPYPANNEDDPLEFLRDLKLKYRIGKPYYAWFEPTTKGLIVRVE